jgi:hypothetical protein
MNTFELESPMERRVVPVTFRTGFLGVGKTTPLNRADRRHEGDDGQRPPSTWFGNARRSGEIELMK